MPRLRWLRRGAWAWLWLAGGVWPSSWSSLSRFRLELRRGCVGDSAFNLSPSARASANAAGLAVTNESVTSCIATFRRNCGSCIVVLQVGHFPSVTMHLRMQREQKVWKHDVMIALVKNSLHI